MNLNRTNDVGKRGGRAPSTDQHESICGIAESESRDENPDVDIPPGADAANETIEIGDVIQIASHLLFHCSLREPVENVGANQEQQQRKCGPQTVAMATTGPRPRPA